jgi:hypothetical protein
MELPVLTEEQSLVQLCGCPVCRTYGFVGSVDERERCQACKGTGCIAGEPICAEPGCTAKRTFCSWYCDAHGPPDIYSLKTDQLDQLDMN